MGEATRIGLAPWLSSHNDKTRRLRSRSPTATRQFSPRKFAPRITSLLLVGEATRIGLAPWLSSQNKMEVYGRRVTTEILTSNIIPIFPLPVVDDLLSELGNSRVFSTTDLISGFFQYAINKDSIPLTAYPTWTVGMDSDVTRMCFFPWMVPVYHVASSRRSWTSETVH